MDPEDVKALAHRCVERLGEQVRRFGGTVTHVPGDQVVAVFGAPVAHEDDAERAVRAALAMRDCALSDDSDHPIQVHIGLDTGEVWAGLFGPAGR
jgi:class 3 adenylate cyclase